MRYFCTDCSHIYDEAIGDPEMDFDAGVKIDELTEFYCPNCEASADMFQPIVEEVLYAEDPEYLSWAEREHIPHILHRDDKEVEFSIGQEVHVMWDDHRITTAVLYDEYGDVVEEHFFSVDEDPIHVFHIEDLDSFEIQASCNQHGVWSTGMIENT